MSYYISLDVSVSGTFTDMRMVGWNVLPSYSP